jgi:hypothetical protein
MNKEILRMQMLAGIITESQYKQKLNEGGVQEVIMYATYLIDNEASRKSDYNGGDFPKDKVPSSFSGDSMSNGMAIGKNVILCSNQPWMIADDGGTPGIEIAVVKFKKPLTDVFLDDEQFLEGFGIEEKYFDEIDELWNEKEEIPLSDLVSYGLQNGNERWYGCYVNDIKSSEIIDIKIASPGNYDEGEWKQFTSPPIPIKKTSTKKPKPKTKTITTPPPGTFTMKSFEVNDYDNRILDNVKITLLNGKGEEVGRNMSFWKRNVGDEKYQTIINNLNNYNNDDSSKKYIDELIASGLKSQSII